MVLHTALKHENVCAVRTSLTVTTGIKTRYSAADLARALVWPGWC